MSTNTFKSERSLLRGLRYAHALFRGVLILIVLLIVCSTYIFTLFRVDGHSMESTLHDGQMLGVNLTAYWFMLPKKGDVVIVQYAGDTDVRFVKRVVGVPGEVMRFDGKEVVLGPEEYFVVGDNRDHSTDSRVYGPVKRTQILGHVLGASPFPTDLE